MLSYRGSHCIMRAPLFPTPAIMAMHPTLCTFRPLCVLATVLCFATYAADGPETDSVLASKVLPIFRTYCLSCHGEKKQAGDLRLDTLSTDLNADQAVAERWQRVLEMLESGEMPPEKAKQLRPAKQKKLTKSIAHAVKEALEVHSQNGGHSLVFQ